MQSNCEIRMVNREKSERNYLKIGHFKVCYLPAQIRLQLIHNNIHYLQYVTDKNTIKSPQQVSLLQTNILAFITVSQHGTVHIYSI